MDITLYYTPRTRAFRVRWLLEELKLPYKLIYVDLFRGEGNTDKYKTIHPLGHVPVIDVDGKRIRESAAICAWLTDHFAEKKLAPKFHSAQWSDYEQWMYFVPGTLEPPIWHYLLHKSILPESQRIKQILPWCLGRYREILDTLDRELKNKRFIVSNTFSTADIMLGSTLSWTPELIKPLSALNDYMQRLINRPAYITALE